MSSLPVPQAERFEVLSIRFFDGLLTDAEDYELAGMLAAEPILAHRFRQWVRTERALASMNDEPVDTESFVASVLTGLELEGNEADTDSFTDGVMDMVRKPGAALSQRRIRASQRLRAPETTPFPAIGVGIAAGLVCAVLLILGMPSPHENRAEAPANSGTPPQPTLPRQPARPTQARPAVPKYVASSGGAARAENMPASETGEPVEPPAETVTEPAAPAVEPGPGTSVAEPRPSEPAAAPAKKIRLGSIEKLGDAKAVWIRGKQDPRETPAAEGDEILADAVLRVTAGDVADAVQAKPASLLLASGYRMELKPGASVRFLNVQGRALPEVEVGAVALSPVNANAGELFMRCAQGPDVVLQNAFASLLISENGREAKVDVEKGRVVVSSFGISRYVFANQACVTEFGRAPSFPRTNVPPPPANATGTDTQDSDAGSSGTGAATGTGTGTGGDASGGKPGASGATGNGGTPGAAGASASKGAGSAGSNAGGNGGGNTGSNAGGNGGGNAGGASASKGAGSTGGNAGGSSGGNSGAKGSGGNAGGNGGGNAGGAGGPKGGPKIGP